MGIKTSLTKASSKGKSLRVTVPISIVEQFDLQEGDNFDWRLKVKGGELVIEVKPEKK